jgi:hypothetical protein
MAASADRLFGYFRFVGSKPDNPEPLDAREKARNDFLFAWCPALAQKGKDHLAINRPNEPPGLEDVGDAWMFPGVPIVLKDHS